MIWLPLAWCPCASPSSRRAWIEIFTLLRLFIAFFVALLAEGVDRNIGLQCVLRKTVMSPSSRRAWIEMGLVACALFMGRVALLAEGVDRNFAGGHTVRVFISRPPRGGRG